jgi:type IV fimbrial biogenesis protein FimT
VTRMRSLARKTPPPARRPAAGFTLVEMVTVVAVLVVSLGVVAPPFAEFLGSQRAKGLAYDLIADLTLARNEALKRNVAVAITRSASGWQDGWAVASVMPAQTLSRRDASVPDVSVTGAPAAITFDVNGRVASPTAGVRFAVGTRSSLRCIELDLSGRARSLRGACP